jgi:large subunit ribosomal protein L6
MSKIGRKPIFFKNVQVEVDKNKVSYKGSHANGLYEVDSRLEVKLFNDNLVLSPIAAEVNSKDINMIWGLHRALLNNAIQGSAVLFEKHIRIEGLGFKAEPQQNNVNHITFSLGFSHKIDFVVPKNVFVEIDKTKQNIVLKSSNKEEVGKVAAHIRALRPVEPYKGKGIFYKDEFLMKKAGKTK